MNLQRFKVVIANEPSDPNFGSELKSLSDVAEVILAPCATEEELIEVAHDADVIVAVGGKIRSFINGKVLSKLERIRIVITSGVGYDRIDLEAATNLGIPVANTVGFCTAELAEHALALIFSAARKVPFLDRVMRSRAEFHYEDFMPIYRLREKTAGVIGFGRSGRAISVMLKGCGLRVIAYDHHPDKKMDVFKELGVEAVSLTTLLQDSDVITIHAPLTEQTYHMIGEKELSMMKKTAIIVNTSRGGIIDEEALYRALKDGRILAAGLDVFEDEAFSADNPLARLDNVVVTPHFAASSVESDEERLSVIASNIRRVLSGEKPANIINIEST